MKTKLLVEGWKDYLNQENYRHRNTVSFNESEINALIEAYESNKNKLNEGKFSDFFIDLKKKSVGLSQKITKLKEFFKGKANYFKNFISFIKRNKINLIKIVSLPLFGLVLLACDSSQDPETARRLQSGYDNQAIEQLQDTFKKHGVDPNAEHVESLLVLTDKGSEVVDLSKNDSTSDNDEKFLEMNEEEISLSAAKSTYGIFFINKELQQSLINQASEAIKSIRKGEKKEKYERDGMTEVEVEVGKQKHQIFVIKSAKDSTKGITDEQAKIIRTKLFRNFDNLENQALAMLEKHRKTKFPKASKLVPSKFWSGLKSQYQNLINRCLEAKEKIGKHLGGYACHMDPELENLNRELNGSLFITVAFDRGDDIFLEEAIRHEFSHVINDHDLEAHIYNEFMDKMHSLMSGKDSMPIDEDDLIKRIQDTDVFQKAEKQGHEFNIKILIEQFINSGLIERTEDGESYKINKKTDEYMSHYNEIRQHRIDVATKFMKLQSQLKDKKSEHNASKFGKVISELFESYADISLEHHKSFHDDRLRFSIIADTSMDNPGQGMRYAAKNISDKVENSESYKKFKKQTELLEKMMEGDDDIVKSVVGILKRTLQLSLGKDRSPNAFKKEIRMAVAIFNFLADQPVKNDSQKKLVQKNAKQVKAMGDNHYAALTTMSNDNYENLVANLVSSEAPAEKKEAAKVTIKSLKEKSGEGDTEATEAYEAFKDKYKEMLDMEFSYDLWLKESKVRFEDILLERVYARLLSESKKNYSGSHPEESYHEWSDLEDEWFDKKGLATWDKDRQTTKNYFKDMGMLK